MAGHVMLQFGSVFNTVQVDKFRQKTRHLSFAIVLRNFQVKKLGRLPDKSTCKNMIAEMRELSKLHIAE